MYSKNNQEKVHVNDIVRFVLLVQIEGRYLLADET